MLCMKRFLAAALLLALPGLGHSVAVPQGKAAVLEAVIGKVNVSLGGKDLTAKVGQALDFGDAVRTGANGRVSIRHADNAVSRLAPNSELTLRAPGEKKGIFLSLKTGFIRFLVGKRAPGESFEVSTPNAVAAVKGTDASVETDGRSTESAVYESDSREALSLLDLISGRSIMLSPGEIVGLTSAGFERRTLDKADFSRASEAFRGLPAPSVDAGSGGSDGEETRAKAEVGIALAEAVSDAFRSAMDDLRMDNVLERDERKGDIVAGRIAYDRNGTRTQISSYVLASGAKLLKATYSKRETGPFAGVSYAQEETTYNRALPEYWPAVVRRSLTDPANLALLDPQNPNSGYPIYYKLSQYFVAGNPQGDLMEVLRNYEAPTFSALWVGWDEYDNELYDAGPLNTEQGYSQGLYLNGRPVFYFEYLTDKSYFDHERQNDPLDCDYCTIVQTSLPISNQPYSYDYWSVSSNQFALGGAVHDYYSDYYYYSPPFLSVDVRVLDQSGQAQDIYSVVPAYRDDRYAGLPRDFKGVDNAFNIELTFRSQYLRAPIDLLVIPEVFDLMDFFDVPWVNNNS